MFVMSYRYLFYSIPFPFTYEIIFSSMTPYSDCGLFTSFISFYIYFTPRLTYLTKWVDIVVIDFLI